MDVAIQPNGQILLGGSVREHTAPRYSNFLLVRCNSDGSLDPSFGVGGRVQTIMSRGGGEIRALKIQRDGKILAGGYVRSEVDETSDFALARYLPQ